MTATHVLLTCEQPSPLSLSPSPSLAVSLFPMAGACDIRRIARPRRVLSIVHFAHQFRTIACQSEAKERVILKNWGIEFSCFPFFFYQSLFAFCSSIDFANPSEITTRKIVKKKEEDARFARKIRDRFSFRARTFDRFPRSLSACLLYVFRGYQRGISGFDEVPFRFAGQVMVVERRNKVRM